ncbi:MAG: ornithine carbamoyltransferase [Candidatus Latescibacteria bacterium]|nr:ornithine carbamoyltransferase [Candidatus Latescibacterota bacterium]
MKKDLLSIQDLTTKDVNLLIDTALKIKSDIKDYSDVMHGRTVVLIFDKPSLRTRITFEVAMRQFGGNSIYMHGNEISLGVRETVSDAAKNLSRWVDGVVMRTFGHDIIAELAESATIPVVNALTDLEHPCQALACLLTLHEHFDNLHGRKMVFVGDGNNVAHSLMLLAPLAGMDFTMCCPVGYEPDDEIASAAKRMAVETGTTYLNDNDPESAVKDADLIYTDVWASMGQECEAEKRSQEFQEYQVNSDLLAAAGTDCLVTHCLPAHRGEEITSEVLDSPRSIAFDEAENRLHIQKAVLYTLLGM